MRMSRAPYLLFGLFVLIAAPLFANAGASTDWQVPILPDRGMYYTPDHGGTGLNIDVDPNGYIFATFYTYTADGSPTFYLMEGQFQPAGDIVDGDYLESRDQIGSFDATLYTSKNGECLGTECTYRNPDRALTDHKAHILWITQRHARLTIDSQSWDLWAGQYTSADTDKIAGTWTTTLTRRFPPDSNPSSRVAILKIRKSEYPGSVLGSGGSDRYKIYDVACAGAPGSEWDIQSVCPEFYVALRGRDSEESGPNYWLLYKITDGTLQLFPYDVVDGKPRFRTSTRGNVYQLELAPGVMRGRGITYDDTGTYETHVESLDMIRVPDGTFDSSTAAPGSE